ncbi:MAG: CerR family C-terminal domain-containing protein [Gammaproteobacteria bacterium]|nr:CerR family C-terminal domain-containing protein [Gammaproteobacteria bacterium]
MDGKSAETRDSLIQAAIPLFAESGFKGVSVREICAAAGANVAAVQYHFDGKEGLYRAVFEALLAEDEANFSHAMQQLQAMIDEAQGDRDALAITLSVYIDSFFSRFPCEPHRRWYAMLVVRELSFPGLGFELIYQRRAQPSQQIFTRIIAGLQHIDENSDRAKLQAYVLMGTMLNVIVSRHALLATMGAGQPCVDVLTQASATAGELIFNALGLTSKTLASVEE